MCTATELALAAGPIALAGGVVPDGPGAYYPPTVLAGCTDEMRVVEVETFGPVAPSSPSPRSTRRCSAPARFPYGLAATVLTGSMANADRACRALDVGTVKINAVFGGAPGGAARPRRGSGQGFGPELLDEMTATDLVHLEAPPQGW
jgi:acyl-CoA reductase-like NAD-dependent aldehyde dehydrogenase